MKRPPNKKPEASSMNTIADAILARREPGELTLFYDHLGYAVAHGHYIKRPQIRGEKFSVIAGSHPHDPDGSNEYVGVFKTEEAAIAHAKELYRIYLQTELSKL